MYAETIASTVDTSLKRREGIGEQLQVTPTLPRPHLLLPRLSLPYLNASNLTGKRSWTGKRQEFPPEACPSLFYTKKLYKQNKNSENEHKTTPNPAPLPHL